MKKRGRSGDRRLGQLGVAVNARQKMNGIDLLAALPDKIANFFILDPQYRGVLDHLAFGNEGARQQGRHGLPQMADDDIAFFAEELQRVCRPMSHGVLWMDKFALASSQYRRWLRGAKQLEIVDLIAWDKLTMGMGRRARCGTEYAMIVQKQPTRARGCWTDHSIRDTWPELHDPRLHPHCKPLQLTMRLIRAATDLGGLVVDPCAGSFSTLEACVRTGRNFVGCDLNG